MKQSMEIYILLTDMFLKQLCIKFDFSYMTKIEVSIMYDQIARGTILKT